MSMQSNRRGFALPLVVLVIALVTSSAVAAFTRTGMEAVVSENVSTEAQAFALAEAGLHAYVSRGRTTPADTTITFTGGSATVSAIQVRSGLTNSDTTVWLIRSVGTVPARGNRPAGSRTVAQFAFRIPGTMDVDAGWTSLSGLQKNGGAGYLGGADNCGEADPVAGVAVPDGRYLQSGGSPVPSGDPAIDYMGTPSQMADEIDIDWAGILSGDITPDIRVPPGSFPTAAQFADTTYWPVIYIDNGPTGSFSLPRSGRGTIIVEGNMTISGALTWRGILLIGGALTSNGNNTVQGATISALNVKLGMSVPINSVGNGTKTFEYDSCNVASALSNFSKLSAFSNAWVDNWANW